MKKAPAVRKESTRPQFDISRKSKLVVRLAAWLSVLTVASIVASGLYEYQRHKKETLKNLQILLQLAANTIAISIDGDQYQTLRGRASIGSDAYNEIKSALQQFMVNSYLGFEENTIYTFRQISPDSLEFTVMLQEQYVGNRYGIRDEMRLTLEQGKPSYTDIYRDDIGVWVSAYAPISNSDGQVVGLVEVDFRNHIFLMALKEELYDLLIFSAIGILISIAIAVVLSRYISRPIVHISESVVDFAQGNAEVLVPVTTRDEIGMLARAFNYMVEEVKEKEFIRRKNEELTEAYRQLDELNHSLAEANNLKTEFLSIAAHDLKNPLQVIKGFCEMILDTPGQDERIYHHAGKIDKGTARMLRIISDLLDTTRIDSGNFQIVLENVDVVNLAERVVQENRLAARNKRQRLVFSAKKGCIAVANSERLHQVLDNLVSNAVKFSPLEKNIIVRVYSESTNGRHDQGNINIEVRDHGPGIDPAEEKRLFQRFSRLSNQPTAGESSTGLGLAISKQLVELMGGKIWFKSDGPGKGTTFFVSLTAARPQSIPKTKHPVRS